MIKYPICFFSMAMTNDQKCFACLHREIRPELGVNGQLVYCRKKEMVVRPKTECTLYSRATKQSVKDLHRAIYGEIEEEE
jgi:hypothetical protein